MFKYFLFSIVIISITSCNPQKEEKKQIAGNREKEDSIPYDLMNPDIVYHLPSYLKEISGISYYKKNKIACIQDERAIIYIYDIQKKKITSKFDFGKNNDYEDIALVDDTVYILRSDGNIFKVKNIDTKRKIKTIEIETPLKKINDTEGLVYDKSTNSLLIACKESPSINTKELYKGFKAIYRFDLNNDKFIEKPEYLIDLSKLYDNNNGSVKKLFIETAKKLNLTSGDNIFYPSGLAIPPFDDEKIYVISSIGKLLLIINRQGKILDIIELDKNIFNQPEGICFSKDGNMFISNEGKNGGGNIVKFNLRTDSYNIK